MPVTSLTDLSDSQKQELVASLACLLAGSGDEVSAETLEAIATASGNSLSGAWASLFAGVVNSAGGIEKFCAAPGSGGGGGGGGGGGAAAAEVEEEEEEEEEEADIGGGVDMFGGDDGGDY